MEVLHFLDWGINIITEHYNVFELVTEYVFGPSEARGNLHSVTGDQTCTPCIKGTERLSHWATREVPVTEYVLFPDLSFFQGISGFISDLDIPQFFRRSPIWSSLISLLPTVWFILEMNFFLYAYDSLFPKEGYRYF